MSPEDDYGAKAKTFFSDATDSETFFFVLCFNATKFALLSEFILIQTVCPKLWQSHCTQMQKASFRLTHVSQKRPNLKSLIRNHHGDGNGNVKKQ